MCSMPIATVSACTFSLLGTLDAFYVLQDPGVDLAQNQAVISDEKKLTRDPKAPFSQLLLVVKSFHFLLVEGADISQGPSQTIHI